MTSLEHSGCRETPYAQVRPHLA